MNLLVFKSFGSHAIAKGLGSQSIREQFPFHFITGNNYTEEPGQKFQGALKD